MNEEVESNAVIENYKNACYFAVLMFNIEKTILF